MDPGFPRGGANSKRGANLLIGQIFLKVIICPNFPKNCMKMKKIRPKRRRKLYYADPPLLFHPQ